MRFVAFEAGDYIRFAYNELGMNFDDSDSDQREKQITAEAHLEKARLEMLNGYNADVFIKKSFLTREPSEANDLEDSNLYKQGYSTSNLTKWYGYTIPYDFIRIISSNAKIAQRGEVIYSNVDSGLEIDYVYNIPYNKIGGLAQQLLIKLLAYSLTSVYSMYDKKDILFQDIQYLGAKINNQNNEKTFKTIKRTPISRW